MDDSLSLSLCFLFVCLFVWGGRLMTVVKKIEREPSIISIKHERDNERKREKK